MTENTPGAEDGTGGVPPGRLSDSARVEAFSDGVIAIAITLLVLDLRTPVPGTDQAWPSQLLHQWPGYLAYLASFGYIGVIWVNHHQLFTRIAAVYALVAAFMALTWLVLFHHLARHERLLAARTPASFFAEERRRALLGVIAYLLAAAVALWQPLGSLLIICTLPVFYGATSEGWRGIHHPHRQDPWM
jgi:uncharacterized membrane protein